MGVVYQARDPILNRKVAIKTISASLGADHELRQRFQREARAAASLNHPNIITIHDFGEEQGQIYMALELLEGVDLKELIGTDALKTIEEKLGVMEQICDGLAFAHAKHIVHRDLKPGNIHIQPNGQVKILDFGLARLAGSDITRSGIVMGTPNYMSPEQVMGDKVDARSDIFSLGAVFYEILTNHKPFEADSVHAVLYQVVHKDPQPVREWNPDVPRVLVELVEKSLSKDPAERFDNAGVLRETLRGIRQAHTAGRLEQAILSEMLVLELVEEADASPPSGGSADGTLSLDEIQRAAALPPKTPPPRPSSLPPRPAPERPAEPSVTLVPRSPHTPYYVGAGLALAGLAVAAWFVWRPTPGLRPAADPAAAASAQMGALKEALVQTQLDLARRIFEDKDYQDAITQAERALRLDPQNAQAIRILGEARATQEALDAAATEARTAFDAGDTTAASQALSRVLVLDPAHPVAAELSGKLNRFFAGQASEARKAMAGSRVGAERAAAQSRAEFVRAVALADDAEAFLGRGEFAQATQGFLRSRDSFDRARRASEASSENAAAEPRAAEQAALQRAATERAVAPLPPPTLVPALPSTQPPASAPAEAILARVFVATRTSIQGARVEKGRLAGFDTSGVQSPPEFQGSIEFEMAPPELRPGDAYSVAVFLVNQGTKSVKLQDVGAWTTVDGTRTDLPAELRTREARAGKKVLVCEVAGVWQGGAKSWSLDVSVSSEKGETYKSRLKAN